jgi:hypothetical protein
MRSIQRRFEIEKQRNLNLSSFICFCKAVRGQKFSRDAIKRWFNKLVEKDDYRKSEKKLLISHLTDLSNCPEDTLFEGISTSATVD